MRNMAIFAIVLMLVALLAVMWFLQAGVGAREVRAAVATEAEATRTLVDMRCDVLEKKLDEVAARAERVATRLERIESKLDKLIDLVTPRLPDDMKIAP